MTPATDLAEALAARKAAEQRLALAQSRNGRVDGITGSLERLLQENHFSQRIAGLFGIEDDRR